MTASNFSIAAAQSSSVTGDLAANVNNHVRLTELAAKERVDAIVFPELSLTGYSPQLAPKLAMDENDPGLEPLRSAATKHNITILAGCPIASNETRPYIATLIIAPNRETKIYRKRFVHVSEDPFFVAGDQTVIFSTGDMRIGVAICADIHNENHPADVSACGADIYAAGVAITPGGIDRALTAMQQHAELYGFLTVMSNYSQPTGDFDIGGQSAIWDESGALLAKAGPGNDCLVVAKSNGSRWTGTLVECPST